LQCVGIDFDRTFDRGAAASHYVRREKGVEAPYSDQLDMLFHALMALLRCQACTWEWSVGRRIDDDRIVGLEDYWGKRSSAIVCPNCQANVDAVRTQAGGDAFAALRAVLEQRKKGRPADSHERERKLEKVRATILDRRRYHPTETLKLEQVARELQAIGLISGSYPERTLRRWINEGTGKDWAAFVKATTRLQSPEPSPE
jgi:hypothetical protein